MSKKCKLCPIQMRGPRAKGGVCWSCSRRKVVTRTFCTLCSKQLRSDNRTDVCHACNVSANGKRLRMAATCTMCPRKLRSDNTSGMCKPCYVSPEGQRRRYKLERPKRSRKAAATALVAAKANGHAVPMLEPDTEPETWIGICSDCDGYLAVDLDATPQIYGSVKQGTCPGEPTTPPSVRRDPMNDPNSTTPMSLEAGALEDAREHHSPDDRPTHRTGAQYQR